jgi:hypothetical protein
VRWTSVPDATEPTAVDADFIYEDKMDNDDEHASEVERTSPPTTSRRSGLMEWAYRRFEE